MEDEMDLDDLGAVQRAVMGDFLRQARLIPSEAFAELVGWSIDTERQNRSRGKSPPFIKVGRKVMYRYEDVCTWIQTCRRVEKADAAVSQSILRKGARQ